MRLHQPNPIQKLNNEKIKQYTRLTVVIDDPGQNYGLVSILWFIVSIINHDDDYSSENLDV